MKFSRRIKRRLEQLQKAVQDHQEAERGGVLKCSTMEEFEHLRATLPPAGPGQIGVLLAPPTLSAEEWFARHGGPITHYSESP